MADLHVTIPDELEKRLRGNPHVPNKKGALSEWIAEAIREKLKREEREEPA